MLVARFFGEGSRRDELEDKIIGISGWRGKHDDNGYEPMLKQAHEWSIEGLIASPQLREGQDALATDFLNHCALI